MNHTPAPLPLHASPGQHYRVACRASAIVLARQGHPDQARALQAEAEAAAQLPADVTGAVAPTHRFTPARSAGPR